MSKVCYSIKECDDWSSFSYLHYFMLVCEDALFEIRFDGVESEIASFKEFKKSAEKVQFISTYRISNNSEASRASEVLSEAIIGGTDYIDLDINFPEASQRWLISLAMNYGCKVIISYHHTFGRVSIQKLRSIVDKALLLGADIVKIVINAHSEADIEKVLSLYDEYEPSRLIAFAMGEKGTASRFAAVEKGAPFLYAAPTRASRTASGQPTYFDLLPKENIILKGEAQVPSSKSFAQRAIFLASLTNGTSKLYNLTLCGDTSSAISLAKQFGAEVEYDSAERTLTITGHQDLIKKGLVLEDNHLFIGESALLTRLCITICGLAHEPVEIMGDKSILKRKLPQNEFELRKLGIRPSFKALYYLPVKVFSSLKGGGKITIYGDEGSQVISGLLVALSQCHRKTTLIVRHPTSAPYLDLTEHILSCFGVDVGYEEDDEQFTDGDDTTPFENKRIYHIASRQTITPVLGMEVEKDWSAAAFLLVAGALMGDITISGMDMFSPQGDICIMDILEECRADVTVSYDNHTINVRKSVLHEFTFDLVDNPDLFAPLVVLGLKCNGTSIIDGIGRLSNKESDRAKTFLREFKKLGAKVSIEDDMFIIQGSHDAHLRGAKCLSHGDHRLAMALKIASLMADGEVSIKGSECVDKSFPSFFETIESLKTKITD